MKIASKSLLITPECTKKTLGSNNEHVYEYICSIYNITIEKQNYSHTKTQSIVLVILKGQC